MVLYLELTAAQIQLQVYRGNLVHSRELQQIEVLQDYLLGFDGNGGEVCATACMRSKVKCGISEKTLRLQTLLANRYYIFLIFLFLQGRVL